MDLGGDLEVMPNQLQMFIPYYENVLEEWSKHTRCSSLAWTLLECPDSDLRCLGFSPSFASGTEFPLVPHFEAHQWERLQTRVELRPWPVRHLNEQWGLSVTCHNSLWAMSHGLMQGAGPSPRCPCHIIHCRLAKHLWFHWKRQHNVHQKLIGP